MEILALRTIPPTLIGSRGLGFIDFRVLGVNGLGFWFQCLMAPKQGVNRAVICL